jgi:GGDEF domain-containing protein
VAPSQALLFTSSGAPLPPAVNAWLASAGFSTAIVRDGSDLMAIALRGRPRLVLLDARDQSMEAIVACRRLKADSYTGVVPALLLCAYTPESLDNCFASDADEVLHLGMSDAELCHRLATALRRSDRDVSVHPSTRLPGTFGIEAELTRRIAAQDTFAVCYADLDHFKEYNDRYSYNDGDRVIRVVAKILHDVVKGTCGERGFVGHIGGDDFIVILAASDADEVCSEVVSVFDLIVPYQYSEPDRRAGYFFGKDRRGQLHRVPLMTLSIGVVTNERRAFSSAAQVSELATEMKGYAKTLPGSVYSVDRRQEHLASLEPTPVREHDALSIIED